MKKDFLADTFFFKYQNKKTSKFYILGLSIMGGNALIPHQLKYDRINPHQAAPAPDV